MYVFICIWVIESPLVQLSKQTPYSTKRQENNRRYPPKIIYIYIFCCFRWPHYTAPHSHRSLRLPVSVFQCFCLPLTAIPAEKNLCPSVSQNRSWQWNLRRRVPNCPQLTVINSRPCCTISVRLQLLVFWNITLNYTKLKFHLFHMDVTLCVFSTKNSVLRRTSGSKPDEVTERVTDFMQLSPSWAADSSSTALGIVRVFETPIFITVLTTARHFSPLWATWIQSTPSYLICLRSILILSYHLSLVLSSGHFPSGFSCKTPCVDFSSEKLEDETH